MPNVARNALTPTPTGALLLFTCCCCSFPLKPARGCFLPPDIPAASELLLLPPTVADNLQAQQEAKRTNVLDAGERKLEGETLA